jgi:branched-chain amino acid transport system ATP-binding protein
MTAGTTTEATLPADSVGGEAVLRARGLGVRFGGVQALDEIDLTIATDQVLGLIGPNGAGKTTFVNAICGFVRPSAGSVSIGGRDVTSWAPDKVARAGLARTYQGAKLFAGLTVFENVEVGALSVGAGRREARKRAWELLETMDMDSRWDLRAGQLSHGDERRVGILRALAARPSLLLLDEPAAGLDDDESAALMATIREVRVGHRLAVLLIEHDMKFVMSLCDMIQVLDHGKTIATGTPAQIVEDPLVREAYLGSHATDAGGDHA